MSTFAANASPINLRRIARPCSHRVVSAIICLPRFGIADRPTIRLAFWRRLLGRGGFWQGPAETPNRGAVSMIHVIAIITAKPGMRGAILEAFHANMPAVHAE